MSAFSGGCRTKEGAGQLVVVGSQSEDPRGGGWSRSVPYCVVSCLASAEASTASSWRASEL
jgi:hypothetical protein